VVLVFVVVGILVTKEGEEGLCDFVCFWIFVCKSFVMLCVFWVWVIAGEDCSICVCGVVVLKIVLGVRAQDKQDAQLHEIACAI
jgi:hypothetical protein